MSEEVYQSMDLYLDASIDKVQNLFFDVKHHRMLKKWDVIYERKQEMLYRVKSYTHKFLKGRS